MSAAQSLRSTFARTSGGRLSRRSVRKLITRPTVDAQSAVVGASVLMKTTGLADRSGAHPEADASEPFLGLSIPAMNASSSTTFFLSFVRSTISGTPPGACSARGRPKPRITNFCSNVLSWRSKL